MDTSVETSALATGPAKRTLSNTVASLALILDLLSSVVATIEAAGKTSGKTSGQRTIKGFVLPSANQLNAFATTIRACRQRANSSQELKDSLLGGIDLAHVTIVQLRIMLAPSAGRRISEILFTPVRGLFRSRRHFTYADFYQQSEQVLNGLSASRTWVLATPLRRRVTLPQDFAAAMLSDAPAISSNQLVDTSRNNDLPSAAAATPAALPSALPFVVTRRPSSEIEFNDTPSGEHADLTGTTPRRWTTRETASPSQSYGMAAMLPPMQPPPRPSRSSPSRSNATRKRQTERGVNRWPMPDSGSPTPPVDPASETGAG